jgi:hypothetical protein
MKITPEEVKKILYLRNRLMQANEEECYVLELFFRSSWTIKQIFVYAQRRFPDADWIKAGLYILDNGGSEVEAVAQAAADYYNTLEVIENDWGDSHD